jgi:hypothetical protein
MPVLTTTLCWPLVVAVMNATRRRGAGDHGAL